MAIFYDFSVDYSAISNDKIHDIHVYLVKKNGIIQMFQFVKKYFFTSATFIICKFLNVIKNLK